MKRLLIPLAALVLSCAAGPAFAGDTASHPSHVVELFTSQGCSSCPPANEFVSELAEDPDMLVLSYGVTYWDFLGWKDTFGSPDFTQRQRDYRDAFGAANIYTPQIVLAGSAHSPRYTEAEVKDFRLLKADTDLTLSRTGEFVTVKANAPKHAIIDVVSYTPGQQSVKVKRGENGGRTLHLTNVVTSVQTLDWNGQSESVKLPQSPDKEYAVLIHDRETAKIVDAAVIR